MRNINAVFARFLRHRYAVPVILLAAATTLFVNELTYRRTSQVLRGGIELTDARIQSARVLQLLTDAETGQRGFMLTGQKEFLWPYQAALEALPAIRSQLEHYFNATGSDAETHAQKADGVIESKLSELAKVLDLEDKGQHAAAIELIGSGEGRELMDELRDVISTELERASRAPAQARISIYDALQFNRVAAALLALAGTAGLLISCANCGVMTTNARRAKCLSKVWSVPVRGNCATLHVICRLCVRMSAATLPGRSMTNWVVCSPQPNWT
ncbi:MAG: CHASE3 domain-containing protein [Ramlibacter sp.]|nr:CHASE3 domain-containing protein [Ramlibacter sp.]